MAHSEERKKYLYNGLIIRAPFPPPPHPKKSLCPRPRPLPSSGRWEPLREDAASIQKWPHELSLTGRSRPPSAPRGFRLGRGWGGGGGGAQRRRMSRRWVARCKMPNSVLRKENFWILLFKLPKTNCLINSQKFLGQPIKNRPNLFFLGLEKAKPGNSGVEVVEGGGRGRIKTNEIL